MLFVFFSGCQYPEDPWDWYIYLHENHKNQPNVGKYTIHGWYGIVILDFLSPD